MAAVSVTSVRVLDNPAPFTNPLQFEIQYECLHHLKHGERREEREEGEGAGGGGRGIGRWSPCAPPFSHPARTPPRRTRAGCVNVTGGCRRVFGERGGVGPPANQHTLARRARAIRNQTHDDETTTRLPTSHPHTTILQTSSGS